MNTQATADVAKAVATFLPEGIGVTIILLMPGYLLGVAYSRGIRGPAPSERAFVANAAVGTIVVHLLLLFWTVPLVTGVVRDGLSGYVPQMAAWTVVGLIVVPTLLGAALALLATGVVCEFGGGGDLPPYRSAGVGLADLDVRRAQPASQLFGTLGLL